MIFIENFIQFSYNTPKGKTDTRHVFVHDMKEFQFVLDRNNIDRFSLFDIRFNDKPVTIQEVANKFKS